MSLNDRDLKDDSQVDVLLAALKTERERCAKIAESTPPPSGYEGDSMTRMLCRSIWYGACESIARRIREEE